MIRADFAADLRMPTYQFIDMSNDRPLNVVFGFVRYNGNDERLERAAAIFKTANPHPDRDQPILILREESAKEIAGGWDKLGFPVYRLTDRQKRELESQHLGENVIAFPAPKNLQ